MKDKVWSLLVFHTLDIREILGYWPPTMFIAAVHTMLLMKLMIRMSLLLMTIFTRKVLVTSQKSEICSPAPGNYISTPIQSWGCVPVVVVLNEKSISYKRIVSIIIIIIIIIIIVIIIIIPKETKETMVKNLSGRHKTEKNKMQND